MNTFPYLSPLFSSFVSYHFSSDGANPKGGGLSSSFGGGQQLGGVQKQPISSTVVPGFWQPYY